MNVTERNYVIVDSRNQQTRYWSYIIWINYLCTLETAKQPGHSVLGKRFPDNHLSECVNICVEVDVLNTSVKYYYKVEYVYIYGEHRHARVVWNPYMNHAA